MKALVMFLAVAIGAVAAITASQDAAANAEKPTASGEIVRYDAGKTIVIRDRRGVGPAVEPRSRAARRRSHDHAARARPAGGSEGDHLEAEGRLGSSLR